MKNSKADAIRWLRQAEHDLAIAQLVLREGFFSHACFMSQQVVEKALKSLAYYRGDRYVTGHSLFELAPQLVVTYPQLSEFMKLTKTLDKYYLPTRYPDALPGSVPFEFYEQDEAEEAVAGAGRVVDLAKSIVSH
jgi:HEPN domain-containing protein